MSKISQANKQRRWKIYDDFSKNEYHEISDLYDIQEYPNKFYKIITKEYWAIDFYPMSDKLNFRKKNEYWIMENYWKPDWLKWIKTNLLKHL